MVRQLQKQIAKIESEFNITECPELARSVHWTPSQTFPVHRWFRYREGFSPYLFDFFQDSTHRLDPFCGCGTTLLESARQGVHSYGIDLNPLATFVAKVKTRQYSGGDRDAFVEASRKILRGSRRCQSLPPPNFHLLSKLFQPESIDALLSMKACIMRVQERKIRDLLLCSWLSIIERCSNVFKEGNGLKYRNKRRKPGKYITVPDEEWVPRYFGDDIRSFVESAWNEQCANIADDIESFRLAPGFTPRIRTASCFDKTSVDFGRHFDLVIFSPPYANRFDYFEAFKIELWMGDFVRKKDDMAQLRSASMRNNLAAKKFKTSEPWETLQPFLDAMDSRASSVRMGIKNALQGYFHDMRALLKNLQGHLATRGRVVNVVGNSAYAKSIIPTDTLIAAIGKEEGYDVEEIKVARHLHVSSQQRAFLSNCASSMRESVVVLR